MNFQAILAISIATLELLAYAVYIFDTIKGKTQPNRITYLLWGIPVIAGIATNTTAFSWSSLAVLAAGIMPLVIFLCSFVNKNAYWKLTKFDYICGVFAILALIIWQITASPAIAIIFCIIADALAGIPTLLKILKSPETETKSAYIINCVAHSLNLLTIATWTLVESAFPIYLCIMCWTLMLAFFVKSKKAS